METLKNISDPIRNPWILGQKFHAAKKGSKAPKMSKILMESGQVSSTLLEEFQGVGWNDKNHVTVTLW